MPSILANLATLDAIAIIALLCFAAWRDILTRTIPDSVSLALIVVGCLARMTDGWGALVASLIAGAGIFVVLLPACNRGLLGGADLKLMAALAVGLPPQTTLHLIAAVTIVGGGLAVVYLGLKRLVARAQVSPRGSRSGSNLKRIASIECWRIRRSAPLPYGIAIAIGAAIVVLNRQGV